MRAGNHAAFKARRVADAAANELARHYRRTIVHVAVAKTGGGRSLSGYPRAGQQAETGHETPHRDDMCMTLSFRRSLPFHPDARNPDVD
jgi:hypothetical protein